MKLKIKSLQAGGYIAYQPLPTPPVAQPQIAQDDLETDDENGKKKESPTYLDKSTLNKMLGQGITTDVIAYSDELENAYTEYSNMSDLQKNSYKGKQLRGTLKGNMGQLNALIRSKDMLDKAMSNAKANDALEEFAVTGEGMVVKDASTGKITTISFGQYAQDNNSKEKKYRALTNAELAEEREYNKQLIGNSAVFSVLNYGKGMEKVKDEIFKVLGKIGKTSQSVNNGQFAPEQEDMQELLTAAKQGMFKIKSGESVESNSQQIEKAKVAMWVNLSANSKNVLRARAATMITNPADLEKTAMTMAASLLDPSVSTSSSKTYDMSLNKGAGGKSGSGGSGKMSDFGPFAMAYSGGTNNIALSQIGPSGVKIEGFASALPPETYSNDKNERTTIRNAGKLNNISYLSKAFTANGDKINPDLTVITGDAYVTELPYIQKADGTLQIDEAGARKYAEYEEALNKLPHDQRTELKKSELKAQFGVQNFATAKFVVAEAASYDDDFWGSKDERYYEELEGPELDYLGSIVDPKSDHVKSMWDNKAYKHLVFLPAKDLNSFVNADGNKAKVPEDVYAIQQGFNSGRGGMNSSRGNTYGSQASAEQMNLTMNSLFNK